MSTRDDGRRKNRAATSGATPSTHRALRVEVRPGDGGADAELFARELTHAVQAWLRRRGWSASRQNDQTRMLVVLVDGCDDEPALLRLAGSHRVQRIPRNDSKGRRHTSTVSVAVMPQPDGGTAGGLAAGDLRIDTFRGTGPGGQHRNKTDSGVRVTHGPSGEVVRVTRGRSQRQNKAAALEELQRRLRRRDTARERDQVQRSRRSQIAGSTGAAASSLLGAGVPEAKSFTYNQQRNEVLEHATGRRWRMTDFLRGDLW